MKVITKEELKKIQNERQEWEEATMIKISIKEYNRLVNNQKEFTYDYTYAPLTKTPDYYVGDFPDSIATSTFGNL